MIGQIGVLERKATALDCDGSTSLSFFVSLEKKESGVKPAALKSMKRDASRII